MADAITSLTAREISGFFPEIVLDSNMESPPPDLHPFVCG
jgi:hypothetical protein